MRPHSSQGFGIFSSALIFCFMFSLEIILLSMKFSHQLLWYTDTHIMRVGLTSEKCNTEMVCVILYISETGYLP